MLWLIGDVISMSSKKLTDIDIIRVLNCCYDKDEIILSFYENNKLKVDLTVQDIIDFLNRHQAEIENLKDILYDADGVNLVNYWYQQCEIAENGCRNFEEENKKLKAEIKRLKEENKILDLNRRMALLEKEPLYDKIKTSKSEAYKEFVTKAEEKATKLKDCTGTEVVFTVDDIYDLLKEMGCGE